MKRIAISLDEHAHAELAKRAQANAEPVARTAARFVRDALLSTDAREQAVASAALVKPERPEGRPAWLEPGPDARERWRRDTWAAVSAVHRRYQAQLKRLPADWFTNRSLVEHLAALCAWRSALDAGSSDDPRAELLFHDRLEILRRQLEAVGSYRTFEHGPLPEEWLNDWPRSRPPEQVRSSSP